MKYGIKIIGLAGYITKGDYSVMEGQWVQTVNVDAYNGRGEARGTLDPRKAMAFDTTTEAFIFWNQQSKVRPLRPDGRPNKPLTAFSCMIEALPE